MSISAGNPQSIFTGGHWLEEVSGVFPSEDQVLAGVMYGPTGVEFTGTARILPPVAGEDGLSDSPASILAQYLIETAVEFSEPQSGLAWPLFISSMPDSEKLKGDIGSIRDTAGVLDGRIMNSGKTVEHFGIQISLRSLDYQTGWKKGTDIIEFFEQIWNESVIVGSSTYTIFNITKTTPLTHIGVEPGTKRRDVFTINFITTIKEI